MAYALMYSTAIPWTSPSAFRAVAMGFASRMIPAAIAVETMRIVQKQTLNALFISSISPLPSLDESSVDVPTDMAEAMAVITVKKGVARPYAASALVPRKLPVTMPSMMFPMIVVT